MWLTIIIPTYQDDAALQRLVQTLKTWDLATVAVIIVDGEQRLRPTWLPQAYRYLSWPRANRGAQLKAGADLATTPYLWFLHVDSAFPDGSPLPILNQWRPAIGFCTLRYDVPRWIFKWIARGSNFRARRLQMIFGDQSLFVKRTLYQQSGGFESQPLMEDWALSRRLAALHVPMTQLPIPLVTSARKYQQNGVLRTLWQMQMIKLGYVLGRSPQKLWERYYRK